MRKVFIVEDDKFITAIFTMFLKDLGHELVGRTSVGQEAIELCKVLKPDVVLMDIHLEGNIDGIQTAEMLKREIEVPVIYISSDTSSQVIERAIVSNSYGYLVKPINKQELGISIDLAYYKHKVDLEQKMRELSYREFISDSPLPIVVVINGNIAYLNRLGLDVFKTHYIEDVIGLPITDFIEDNYKEEFCNVVDSFNINDKRIKPLMAKMKTVHGDLFWSEITGSIVNFNNHKSVQLILKDISECKSIEQRKIVYENVLLDRNKFCLVLDNSLSIVKTNAYTQKHLGVEKLSGKKIQAILQDGKLPYILNNLNSMAFSNEEVSIKFIDKDSIIFKLDIVKSIDGEVLEVILVEKCS